MDHYGSSTIFLGMRGIILGVEAWGWGVGGGGCELGQYIVS